MTDAQRDTSFHRLLVAAVFVFVIVTVVGGVGLFYNVQNKNGVDAVNRGNRSASCRAQFSGAVTDARQQLDDARAELQVHQFDGEVAGLVEEDTAALEQAVQAGNGAKSRIALARLDYSSANQRYQNLLRAESHDPDLFRQLCRDAP